MADYEKVAQALAAGADPAMLCMTCPWDRLCVNPPTMTSDEVKRKIDEAEAKDRSRPNPNGGMPVGLLMTAMALGGRDTSGQMCPVFSLRLRSHEGRTVADSVRSIMQGTGTEGDRG